MSWINIKDELPVIQTPILIFFIHEGGYYIEIGQYDPKYAKGFEAFGMTITLDEYQHEITHWMELPESPKE